MAGRGREWLELSWRKLDGDDDGIEGRRRVVVNERFLRHIVRDAFDALVATAHLFPSVFQHATGLVRVSDYGISPAIVPLSRDGLRHVLDHSADFVEVREDDEGNEIYRPVWPPRDVIADILSWVDWTPLPVLVGVIRVPTLRPDHTLLQEPGFDPSTRLWYAPVPDLEIPRVPDEPTLDEAIAARDFLFQEVLGDFAFKDAASRANMLATLLTPFVQHSLGGPVPLALISAAQPGSGKTLLANIAALLASGGSAGIEVAPSDADEWRKKISTVLLEGEPVVVLDNLSGRLASGALAAALTAGKWRDRLLGKNQRIRVDVRATWIVTANAPSLSAEIARRTFLIRLDPKVARPSQRTGFRHKNLLHWVEANRGALIAAVLTIIRFWAAKGAVPADVPIIGSYERWSGAVGGILRDIEVPDFLANIDEILSDMDTESEEWERFLSEWIALHPEPISSAQLINSLLGHDHFAQAAPLEVAQILDRGDMRSGPQKLGYVLRRQIEYRYGPRQLRVERLKDTHAKVARWLVREG